MRYYILLIFFLFVFCDNKAFSQEKTDTISPIEEELEIIRRFDSQFSNDSITIKVEELEGDVKYQNGGTPSYFLYCGTLIKGIAALFNFNMSRVKVSKQNNAKNIKYEINTGMKGDLNTGMQSVLGILSNRYNFTVSQISDTCDVWVIKKVFLDKLVRPNYERDGFCCGSGRKNDSIWESVGMPLSSLSEIIEFYSSNIIEEEKMDSEDYNFEVPYVLMKTSHLERLSQYLLDKYGLSLKREKKVVKILHINFE